MPAAGKSLEGATSPHPPPVEWTDLEPPSFEKLLLPGSLGIDTETTGLDPRRDVVQLVQLHHPVAGSVLLQRPSSPAPRLVHLLQERPGTLVFHFARFDLAFLCQVVGPATVLALSDKVVCTKIAARIAGYGDGRARLADLLSEAFSAQLDKSPSVRKSDWGARPLSREQVEYALADVRWLPRLWDEVLRPCLKASEKLAWAQACFRATVALAVRDATGETVWDQDVRDTMLRAERQGAAHLFEY